MYPSIEKIKSILLTEKYISEEDSKRAEAEAQNTNDYIDFLVRSEVINRALLAQALAEYYKVSYLDLAAHPVDKKVVTSLPEAIARANYSILVSANDKQATLASYAPDQINIPELAKVFGSRKLTVVYAAPELITNSYLLYEQPLVTRFSRIITGGKRIAPEIVDEIIKDALSFKASDIHFEPQVDGVLVRFRVDGSLREAGKVPKEYYENILNRIKVESGMRIDEHFAAQDGSIRRVYNDHPVDLRVSLAPTVEGEKVVMRLLGSYIQSYELSGIGLNNTQMQTLQTYAAKPFGMILTVGPTGSGKTTTLYSLVKLLNSPTANITSIEDPVEYKLAGVNQIQVREQTGMTFARGLRSIVRQDPDIILVGEIRDKETADIAINASLTGHLLLSTFHANDAASTIPRLVDMGVEPFLLASTLEIVIAQRLVRRICKQCRYSLPVVEAFKALAVNSRPAARYFSKDDTVYAGKGCNVCNGTGYDGRLALFEFLEVTPEMQDLITKAPPVQEIVALARKQNMQPMFIDGVEKVKSGLTTIAEVLRVVALPDPQK